MFYITIRFLSAQLFLLVTDCFKQKFMAVRCKYFDGRLFEVLKINMYVYSQLEFGELDRMIFEKKFQPEISFGRWPVKTVEVDVC